MLTGLKVDESNDEELEEELESLLGNEISLPNVPETPLEEGTKHLIISKYNLIFFCFSSFTRKRKRDQEKRKTTRNCIRSLILI